VADDQSAPNNTPPDDSGGESESPAGQRGLGRFASRFRRGRDETQPAPEPTEAPSELDFADVDLDRVPWSVRPEFSQYRESGGLRQPEAPGVDELTAADALPTSEEVDEPEPPPDVEAAPEVDAPTPDPEPVPFAATEPIPPPVAATPPEVVRTDPPPTTPVIAPPLPVPPSEFSTPEGDVIAEPVVTSDLRTQPAGISAHLAVLTGVATVVILGFLLIEPSPRWLLLLGAAAVVFGLDGTLRQTWRAPFALGQETAPFLFAPALYMLAVPVLIEHNVSGELVLLVGLGAGLGFGGLAWAELASVRSQAPEYEQARIIVTANTYLAGFAIFSLSYVFDIGLPAAVIATAIAASMLAVEILREGEIDPMETLGLSLVTGVVIGEFRWLLYYIPLDTYLAGLTLLLAFYLTTGLLHSHVIRSLSRTVALEYSGIAAAGIALVVFARAAGLA